MKIFNFIKNRKKTKRGQPRRRVVPLWRNRWTIPVLALVLMASAVGSGWWAVESGHAQKWAERTKWHLIALSSRLGFTVDEIMVVGRYETKHKDLLKAIRLARGAPILAFDLEAARQRVEALPWVRRAIIQRMLPDTIYLRIEERKPLALWQHRGRFALIDETGTVILQRKLKRFSNLLIVVGEKAPKHAISIFKVLEAAPALRKKVKAAIWVSDRRWNIRLDGGIDVKLPEENPMAAWQRLAKYETQHKVFGRDVQVLDLRQPDRLIVRTRAQPDKSLPIAGRET